MTGTSLRPDPTPVVAARPLGLGRPLSVAVVGGGVAGLTCASLLAEHRFQVHIFDKGRRPGGRLSTRRTDGRRFDHGAQYFTASHPAFEEKLETWLFEGAVQPWGRGLQKLEGGRVIPLETLRLRYVGVPEMSALARWLAGGCTVQSGVRVTALDRRGDSWCPLDEGGAALGRFDLAVVAVPAPQAVSLLAAAPDLAEAAAMAGMAPTWALMLAWEGPLGLDFEGAFVESSPLSWVARDSSKPGREPGERWVLHGSHEWSREHLEEEAERVAELLLAAFDAATGRRLPPPVFQAAHRWRYAAPVSEEPLPDRCLFDPALGLGACGDWCGGPRVEGAFLSGRALAERILGRWEGAGMVAV